MPDPNRFAIFTLAPHAPEWITTQSMIEEDWDPVQGGDEEAATLLVMEAMEAGVILGPPDWELSLEYIPDGDGGTAVWFLTHRRSYFIHLGSTFSEWRHVMDRDLTGPAAALSVLETGVGEANQTLRELARAIRDGALPFDIGSTS